MSEEKKILQAGDNKTEKHESTSQKAGEAVARSVYGDKKRMQRGRRDSRRPEKKDEFEQRILDLARVTRVMKGGKRMSFRACVAIGDKKGKVAVGLGKGADVSIAVNKAVNKAKKNMIEVCTVNETIPHEVYHKLGAAKIIFKPSRKGRGVIAGGIVRVILEIAGVKNVTSKILGTNNKVNNAKCTIEALRKLRRVEKKEPRAEKPIEDKSKIDEKKDPKGK